MARLRRVQTGPSSYLKMTAEEAAAYIKAHGEYGKPAAQPEAEQAAAEPEAKAVEQPAENKAVAAPAENKARNRR